MIRLLGILLYRLWSAAVGLLMIALSLLLQLLIFMVIGAIVIPMVLPRVEPWYSILALFIVFNGISCYEYFGRGKVVTLGGRIDQLKGLVRPDSGHVSMAFFLVPRGIDRIVTGRELTNRAAGRRR